MKALPWILAGVGIGVAATILLFNGEGSEPQYATGSGSVERAARKSFGWGAGKQAEGKVGSFAGSIKESIGHFTGNDDLADEGTADKVVGKVKDAAGQLGQAAGQTLHDLNR